MAVGQSVCVPLENVLLAVQNDSKTERRTTKHVVTFAQRIDLVSKSLNRGRRKGLHFLGSLNAPITTALFHYLLHLFSCIAPVLGFLRCVLRFIDGRCELLLIRSEEARVFVLGGEFDMGSSEERVVAVIMVGGPTKGTIFEIPANSLMLD